MAHFDTRQKTIEFWFHENIQFIIPEYQVFEILAFQQNLVTNLQESLVIKILHF